MNEEASIINVQAHAVDGTANVAAELHVGINAKQLRTDIQLRVVDREVGAKCRARGVGRHGEFSICDFKAILALKFIFLKALLQCVRQHFEEHRIGE